MSDRRIREQVERSSFGTPQARAARRTVPTAAAARVVAMAEAQRRAEEARKKWGAVDHLATYTVGVTASTGEAAAGHLAVALNLQQNLGALTRAADER